MAPSSAYQPLEPARRPGSKPKVAPTYRVLIHRKFAGHWAEMVDRVGLQAAQHLWDHLAMTPDQAPLIGSSSFLRGKPARPMGPGWSKTIHFELSSMARVDYQHNPSYKTAPKKDAHPVTAILTINYSSH